MAIEQLQGSKQTELVLMEVFISAKRNSSSLKIAMHLTISQNTLSRTKVHT